MEEAIAHLLAPVLGGLQETLERLPERIVSAAWEMAAGRLLELLLTVVGMLAMLVGHLAGGLFSGVNFFSQIPEPWVTLVALEGVRARLVPLAIRVGALAGACLIARGVAGAIFDWPFPGWTFSVVKILALSPLITAAPVAMLALIHAGNVLSAALYDPAKGLPGLAHAGMDQAAGTGVATLFYLAVCGWLWWVRLQLVLGALLLFATSPLAVACWVLPFSLPQWIARAWVTTFIGVVVVQGLMALTLGLGAALLASNVVSGGTESGYSGIVNVLLAAGLVGATCWLPRRILGALITHAPPGTGLVVAGLKVGVALSGAGWVPMVAVTAAGAAWGRRPAAAPQSPSTSTPVPVLAEGSGRIGSLLGGERRLALPKEARGA